ncbi:hypothetical protein DQJ67_05105 [Salmonella enterica subsp. enterica serovar Newport]|nr:hypothetical protein [Salmonella enterica subsp. enterica serovar Newport]
MLCLNNFFEKVNETYLSFPDATYRFQLFVVNIILLILSIDNTCFKLIICFGYDLLPTVKVLSN